MAEDPIQVTADPYRAAGICRTGAGYPDKGPVGG